MLVDAQDSFMEILYFNMIFACPDTIHVDSLSLPNMKVFQSIENTTIYSFHYTIFIILALYTTTKDLKWNNQDVL